jgi:hypothetical protein
MRPYWLVGLVLCFLPGCKDWDFLSRNYRDGAVPADGGGGCLGCVSGGPYNYVFVTSMTYQPGSFGGLKGADDECQRLADGAKLPGTFLAWLSTSTVDARTRLKPARGFIRPDGRPFADSIDALTAGQIYYPARLDERGHDVLDLSAYGAKVATGTAADGTHTPDTGRDWTSTLVGYSAGTTAATTYFWTSGIPQAGTDPAHLYCFGSDINRPLMIEPTAGRRAFVSNGIYRPSGLSAADALCQAEAQANKIAGTYLALLAIKGGPSISRFDLSGPTWVRLDGVPWLGAAADLGGAEPLTALNLDSTGLYGGYTPSWTGSVNPGLAAGSDTDDCGDWTAPAPTASGYFGRGEFSTAVLFHDQLIPCDYASAHVYCLER